MKDLIIIGCGNVGGFVAYNIADIGEYNILGFLDDDQGKHGAIIYGSKVLGSIDQIEKYLNNTPDVILAISSPSAKATIVQRLSAYDLCFPNLIFATSWLSKKVKIGRGVIIYPGTSINYETNIDDFVVINMNCSIGHNCTLGKFATLSPGVNLGGFTLLEQEVFMGIGAATRQNIRVGARSVVGGQAMVTKEIPANSVVAGVPARIVTR